MAIIFGVAWWNIWKQRPSAKGWGVAASSIHILLSLWMIIFRSYPILSCQGFGLILGTVGLIAFLWRDKVETVTDKSELEDNPT